MKLGILDALDSPRLEYITWHGSTTGTYIHFLKSVDAPFTYESYIVSKDEFPATVDECDAYLITGSVSGAYEDEPWISTLIQFIRDCHAANKKLVGICFGHQVLAHALGGKAEKSDKGWGLGLKTFDITDNKPWMNGSQGQCSLYYSHQDQVVQLPPNAERLGGNEFCENAFFAIGDQVMGIQGHPEFTTNIMQEILSNPKETVPQEVNETAVSSVENGRPDNQLVAHWIVNFLTG